MANVNKFLKARVRAEVLEDLVKNLESKLEDAGKHYDKTGERIQDYDWKDHEKILLWEDEEQTIPKMRDVYDYIPYTDEELKNNPDAQARIEVINDIITALEKLV